MCWSSSRMDSASPPGAREVAGGPVCAPYVVGNLKENFKSDTPKENKDKSKSVCDFKANTYVLDLYSPVAQSWVGKTSPLQDHAERSVRSLFLGFQKFTVSLGFTVCLFACAYNGTQSYLQ